ncbi:MAG: hypothetical protein SFY32_14690 [Bacteroidota bacterium]|nr:hypothetical protein [Bacteroidota bacterium]
MKNLLLINGSFDPKDAIEIITSMIHVKIKFHENKINGESNEEEIKMRETRIKQLQKDLYEFRNFVDTKKNRVQMFANVAIQ